MAGITIGVIGLGRMGEAVVHRLARGKFSVIGFDPSEDARSEVKKLGVNVADSLELVAKKAKYLWLMVPAGEVVDQVIDNLLPFCGHGTVIIDGGNSNFRDSVRREKKLAKADIAFLDCGTSGGLKGREIGFSLMVGGKKSIYDQCLPFFKAIAASNGVAYMGGAGSGHYVKMIHNGIEYALLQAYAEGFHLLKNGSYENLDLKNIAQVWMNGSVVRSWILDLVHEVFEADQELEEISGAIGENKTGRWTLEEAQEQGVPVDLIERSLDIRAESRKTGGNFATKVVAMLRNKFGGHPVDKTKE